ncbi:MAG TPA: tetratricopeptide repeat protein [Casimicrobiaceae bacterium]|jgi:predicted negative regulator of RcsB-dependent stress response
MAAYDLEEQEKIDDLKAWWNQYGNTIVVGVILACVVIIGVQGWRWWAGRRAADAAVLYQAVSDGVRKSDPAKAKDAMNELADKFGGTAYAPRGALLYAKLLFDAGDKNGAKTQLSWVVDHADEDELRAIARYRLAEVQLDEKQYDEALKTLDAKRPASFNGLYADLRGDALNAAGRTADARAAYQEALATLDPKSQYRAYVQVKLDAAGGPAAPTTTPAAAATSPPAASAQPAPTAPPATVAKP